MMKQTYQRYQQPNKPCTPYEKKSYHDQHPAQIRKNHDLSAIEKVRNNSCTFIGNPFSLGNESKQTKANKRKQTNESKQTKANKRKQTNESKQTKANKRKQTNESKQTKANKRKQTPFVPEKGAQNVKGNSLDHK